MGKRENCRIAVSLSVATWDSSLPIAYRLYLPEDWAKDRARRKSKYRGVGFPDRRSPWGVRAAVAAQVARGVVLADAAYGINTEFRDGLTQLELRYVVGGAELADSLGARR